MRRLKEKGFTLVELIVVLSIVGTIGGVTYSQMVGSKQSTIQFAIDSDREILGTKASISYLNNGRHPVIDNNDITQLMTRQMTNFVKDLKEVSGLTEDRLVAETYKRLNTQGMIEEELLTGPPRDDRYILDITSYAVYHETDDIETIRKIYETAGTPIPTLNSRIARKLPIRARDAAAGSVTVMERADVVLHVGTTVVAGGEGTMWLAKIVNEDVYDLSDEIPDAIQVTGITPAVGGVTVEYIDGSGLIKYKVVRI